MTLLEGEGRLFERLLESRLRKLGIDIIEKLAAQDIDALPKIPGASYEGEFGSGHISNAIQGTLGRFF
jgi:hypothetical protein